MALNQSGKSLPFATKGGGAINPAVNITKPTDFGKSNGRSVNADATPPRNPAEYAPTTMDDDESRASPGAIGNRPQQASPTPSYDTHPQEVPRSNRYIEDSARVKQAGTGSSGVPIRPFKNMR
jgi:hypothetical protein